MKLTLFLAMLFSFLMACGQPSKGPVVAQGPVIPQIPIEKPPVIQPGKPGFLRFDQIEQYTTDDAQSLNAADRLNARYLLLCNFYDEGQKDLRDHLAGINKGINMISTERLIAFANTIDDAGCIARIDLDQIGMTSEEWRRFEDANILPFISESVRGRTLRALTQTNQPLVYADSFFTTVMQADQVSLNSRLYYDLTEQPLNDAEFFTKIGINVQDEFNREKAACAGGGRSQIALGKPRMICLFDSADGFLLITYDVSLAKNDSINVNPFTPEMGKIPGSFTNKIFKFVASEMIFSMPNGLLSGFRLSNSGGTAEVVAPTNVVVDVEQTGKGLAPDITLGACSNCHHQEAAIFFQDGVFDAVSGNGDFNEVEKKLADTFYRADKFQAKRAVANKAHVSALQEIGVSTVTKDPVVTNLIQPTRKFVTAEKLAARLFLDVDDFKTRLNGTNLSKVLFGNLLQENGVVQLQDLVRGFPVLKQEMLLFRDEGQL